MLIKWMHHILNSHCAECKVEREEREHCKNCDTLKELLEVEKFEKRELLKQLLKEPEITPEVRYEATKKELMPKTIPWRVKRELLEQEDRVRAQVLKRSQGEQKQSIENLESELGVTENGQYSNGYG